METYLGSQQTQHLFENTVIQNGDPRDNKDLPPDRGVGNLHRLQGRVLPHTNKQPVQEVHAFSYPGRDLSIQSTTLWPLNSPYGVYSSGQGGQTASNETGYKDPPVPRRLVGQSQIPPNLSSAHTALCRELGRLVNEEKSELEPKQIFNFVGYQFDLNEGRVRPTPERWQALQTKILEIMSSVPGPETNVLNGLLTATEKQVHLCRLHMRPIQWHLKNNWRVPETMEKTILIPKSLHPHLVWWLEESNVITGQPLHPLKQTCSANLYRHIKRRVGRSLKRAHSKGKLVAPRKQTAHKLPRVKGSLSGLKRVSDPLYQQHSPHSYRQYYSGCLHKQGRGDEVGPLVCPTVENTDLVYQELSNSQSSSHPRPSKRDSRQAIQSVPDHSNRF